MGTSLTTDRGDSLYSFWGDRITDLASMPTFAESPGANVLVNLASNEYFGSVKPGKIDARIMTPTFLDSKNGGPYKVVSVAAKQARGAMSGWIIQEAHQARKALVEFDEHGLPLRRRTLDRRRARLHPRRQRDGLYADTDVGQTRPAP